MKNKSLKKEEGEEKETNNNNNFTYKKQKKKVEKKVCRPRRNIRPNTTWERKKKN